MSEGNPDKTREDGPAPTEIGEASVRLEKPVSAQEVSESRRRFAKAGLIASPILMSVVSRPVIGGGFNCLSNAMSGNMSNPNRGFCAKVPCEDWTDARNWLDVDLNFYNVDGVYLIPDGKNLGKNNPQYPESCKDKLCYDEKKPDEWCDESGTLFNEVFYGSGESNSLYRILCLYENDPKTDEVDNLEYKAAAVEMLLYSLKYPENPRYALRPVQVQHMVNDPKSFEAFLSHYSCNGFSGLRGYLAATTECMGPCDMM